MCSCLLFNLFFFSVKTEASTMENGNPAKIKGICRFDEFHHNNPASDDGLSLVLYKLIYRGQAGYQRPENQSPKQNKAAIHHQT